MHDITRNIVIILLLNLILSGCSNMASQEDNGLMLASMYQDINRSDLYPDDTIYSFLEEYPVRIADKKGLLFVMLHGSDSLVAVLNPDTRRMERIAFKGNGPDDFYGLEFLSNNYFVGDSTITMFDCNYYKSLIYNSCTSQIEVKSFPFGYAQSINKFHNDSYIGAGITEHNKLFSFFESNGEITKSIDYPFKLSESLKKKLHNQEIYLTPYVYVNTEVSRILTPMYFMDVIYTFDDKGTLLNICSLGSEEFNPNDALSKIFDIKNFVRFTGGYAVDAGCYLLRTYMKPDFKNGTYVAESQQIIVVDWDGKPIKVYNSTDKIKSFCVSQHGEIYAVVLDDANKDSEIYHVIRYKDQ